MGVSKTHLSKNPNLKDLTLTIRPSALGFYGQIYLITNKVNSKTYIGQTVGSVNSRWRGLAVTVEGRAMAEKLPLALFMQSAPDCMLKTKILFGNI